MGINDPIEKLGGRSWAELELAEDADGRLLFADQIRLRTKADGWKVVKVRVRIPRTPELVKARLDTRVYFKDKGLDEKADRDFFEQLEQTAILAICMRTFEEPHAQFAKLDELLIGYDEASLADVQSRIGVYRELLDPKEKRDLTEVEVFEAILAIRRVNHLGPLADIAGDAQRSFIMRMAELACLSPMVSAYVQSLVSSIPAPSPPESSSES